MREALQKGNLKTLQCGRALAAIAVVLFHVNVTLSLPKYFGFEPAHIFSSGFSGVYYFFVLSGTVMALAHWWQIGKSQSPADFFVKRFIRIYIPLWAALLLIVPLLWDRTSVSDIFLAFSGLPASKERILSIEWTLRHEIIFYALFGLLLWRPRIGTALFTLWYAGSIFALVTTLPFPVSFLFSPLHLLFAVGMLGALLIRRGIPAPGALAVSGILIFSVAWMTQVFEYSAPFVSPVLLYGTGSFFMIVGFACMEISKGLTIPSIFLTLGDASYSVYLIHFPVVSISVKLARRFDEKYFQLPIGVYFLFATVAAIGAGLSFHRYIEVPLMRAAKSWFAKIRLHAKATTLAID